MFKSNNVLQPPVETYCSCYHVLYRGDSPVPNLKMNNMEDDFPGRTVN